MSYDDEVNARQRARRQAHDLTQFQVNSRVAVMNPYGSRTTFNEGTVTRRGATQLTVAWGDQVKNFVIKIGHMVGETSTRYPTTLCELTYAQTKKVEEDLTNFKMANAHELKVKLAGLYPSQDNFLTALDGLRAEYVALKAKGEI